MKTEMNAAFGSALARKLWRTGMAATSDTMSANTIKLGTDPFLVKIYQTSEAEIDQRLRLDKRRDLRAFSYNFAPHELPEDFYNLQDAIRDGLQAKFEERFCNTKSRHQLFYFIEDLVSSERIVVQINHLILSDAFIELLLKYLESNAPRYCVIVAVHRDSLKGSRYLGRFVLNLEEIAVEESLAETWSKQVAIIQAQEWPEKPVR